MSRFNRFSPVLSMSVAFAASLACGSAAARNWLADAASQDAPPASREADSGMATGKRQHKPVTMTKEMGKQSGHHTMAEMDTDKDGRLSRSEFAAAHGGKSDQFARHDGDGDGFITQAEMDAHHAAMDANHEAAPTVQQESGKP